MDSPFYYVYLLRTVTEPYQYYVGFTEQMTPRLEDHNAGRDPHTAKYKPWRVKTYVAFTDRQQALAFETYLKTHSGRAFAKKRL